MSFVLSSFYVPSFSSWLVFFDGFELVRSGELAPPKKSYKNEQREGSL
jgi:hypothetical protein